MTPRLALRQRPDAAFETLYRGHVHEVYRYALALLGNPSDAEDVTQTTFLNAYRAFHAGERPRKPTNWLRAIAHNVCLQRFRQAARRPHEVAEFDELAGPAAPEEADAPSAGDISRALQSLPFNQRSALVMRELEGRRQAEIAEALGLSESAVEALLFRARRAMREQLETSITCGEAARAISRQLDRRLSREERASLRAHLRSCAECASFARQARAQRGAFKALGATALPPSLLSWPGAGAGTAAVAAVAPGAALGLKVAAGVAAVVVIAGAGGAGLPRHAARAPDREPATQREAVSEAPSGGRSLERPFTSPFIGPQASDRTSAGRARTGRDSRAKPGRSRPRAPVANGAPPGHATPAAGRSTRAGVRGSPASSNGTPTRAHGSPPHANGTPTRAPGSPAHAHRPSGSPSAAPTRAHGTPEHSQATPTRAHGAPPKPPKKPPKP